MIIIVGECLFVLGLLVVVAVALEFTKHPEAIAQEPPGKVTVYIDFILVGVAAFFRQRKIDVVV